MSPGPRIYADYNATAPVRPEARQAVEKVLGQAGNPSSVHAEGRGLRSLLEACREAVAEAVHACRDDVVFASGGTEAVSQAIRGALLATENSELVVSAVEHDAVASIAEHPSPWPVGADGVVDLSWLREEVVRLSQQGKRPLVSLMLVNNETGVIQPVAEAAEIVHRAGGLIHCDAIQALGKVPVSVIDLDVDYLSLSAHKIGGPHGVGATYIRAGAPFRAIQTGGGQEFGRRAGTENVAGIAGFAASVSAAVRDISSYQAFAEHRDRMENKLKAAAPMIRIHGAAASRVAGVSCFGIEGFSSEVQVMGLDLAGYAVSAGSACSSGKVKPSRVLKAMGLSDVDARSAIRVSFGWKSMYQEFDQLADAWISHARRARPQLVSRSADV